MPTLVRASALIADVDRFLDRLNLTETSALVRTCAKRYATTGELIDRAGLEEGEWRQADLEPIWAEMNKVTLASLVFPLPRPSISDGDWRRAEDWLALIGLYRRSTPLRICPEPGCRRFFVDKKNRGKSACSAEHSSRLRARTYHERLKANPRKYRRYLKQQRDLMRRRRAAGNA